MKYLMFRANGKNHLINPQMIAANYPVTSMDYTCLILKNGKKYNATDIKEVLIHISDGEDFNEGEYYSTGDVFL
ncbi:hypothetical protein [Providencia sp. PROV060]|uniref:hypothetical protein n=1 Tax=Providencia sp. PROV060 TaxID=2949788 RepID=UPI00234B33EF|nr:hypothetical protein [Providencia sp. PROV060]EJD6045539.1 hypothetical protein [Providencia rettgeri]EJD6049608.1 hypothetical protein [Providencia rettgeri]ELR5103410.1 hypothetical protein [Providencia rettgeri]MDI7244446.1 hypothetical protein [Providencia rettgeri]